MNTVIALVTSVILFLPGWTKEDPAKNRVILTVNRNQQQSMTDCKKVEEGLKDITGVYEKTYPYVDKDMNIGIIIECKRVEVESEPEKQSSDKKPDYRKEIPI